MQLLVAEVVRIAEIPLRRKNVAVQQANWNVPSKENVQQDQVLLGTPVVFERKGSF